MWFIRRLDEGSMRSIEGYIREFDRGETKEKQGNMNCYRLQDGSSSFEGIMFYRCMWSAMRLVDGSRGTPSTKGYAIWSDDRV